MLTLNTKRTGIYMIHNLLDGKVYVGSGSTTACGIGGRLGKHRDDLRSGRHANIHLQRAFDRDGESNFAAAVLEFCGEEQCIEREQWWMDELGAADPRIGYNINKTAGSRKGMKHSRETKAKISAKKQGSRMSPESKRKMSAALKGKPKSKKHKQSLRENHWTKQPNAAEIRDRIAAGNRISNKAAYEKDPTLRERTSAATREAMQRPEVKAKVQAAARSRSPETIAKMAATKKAQCNTAEFKEAARQRALKSWREKREAMLKNWETRRANDTASPREIAAVQSSLWD